MRRAGPMKWQWSRQDRIKYIKQNDITHVNQEGCHSDMTLVLEWNYPSHVWQGGEFKISAHMTWTDTSVEVQYPMISPPGTKGPKTLIKRPRGVECMTLKVIVEMDFRTTPETSNLHTPRCCSTPCWSPTSVLPKALPCWTEAFVCPVRHGRLPCLLCYLLDPQPKTLGLKFIISQFSCVILVVIAYE